jgi:hypothetical protein
VDKVFEYKSKTGNSQKDGQQHYSLVRARVRVFNPLSTIFQLYCGSQIWGHRGRDRMIVGFTTIYEISAYHH